MNKETITRVTLEEAKNMEDLTDWEALEDMTDEEAHQNALDDPDAQPIGKDKTGLKRTYRQWSEVAKGDQDSPAASQKPDGEHPH